MRETIALRSLCSLLMLLLLLPPQAQAAQTLPWMTPQTSSHYLVIIRNTPNNPVVATATWTVLNVTSSKITLRDDGILGTIGSLGVSLLSNGTVGLLGARVILNTDYNPTDRLCLRPCPLFKAFNEHAWEWIPSTSNSSLTGENIDILQTTFEVTGNSTLAPYNRTAWMLRPLVQVYLPSVLLYNFWYDQKTGVLLRADLFSAGDGNLTIMLANSSPNLGVQGVAIPITTAQLSIILLSALTSYALFSSRGRLRLKRVTLTPS